MSEKILVEEEQLPEKEGFLGGKTTSVATNGSILKKIKIPFCDVCGLMLKEDVALCSSCKKKLCSSCRIVHENKIFCRECAKIKISVSKKEFMVLFCLANEISPSSIKNLLNTNGHELRKALASLIDKALIERKGISILARYLITDEGLAVLPTCEQIYKDEGDIQHFFCKVHELLGREVIA